MTDHHMIELETKIAHQEHALEELQRVVYDQHKAIEALEAKLARLTKVLTGVAENSLEIGPHDERPPHY